MIFTKVIHLQQALDELRNCRRNAVIIIGFYLVEKVTKIDEKNK